MTRLGRRGLIATGVALVVAATAGATALAVTSHHADRNNRGAAGATLHGNAAPTPSAAVVHHWSIAASGFAPDHINSGGGDYFNQWDPSVLTDNGGRCFNAGVFLPTGATVKSVTFYYTNGAAHDFYGELNRQNLAKRKSGLLASFTSTPTGTSPVFTHKTLLVTGGGIVDTSHFAYSLGVCPQNDSSFTGATIAFTG